MIFQLGPAMLDVFVLSIVSREDTYGYQLSQEIKTVVSLKESTLYPVLRRLLEAGYLEAYDMPYQGRNRKKAAYTVKDNTLTIGSSTSARINFLVITPEQTRNSYVKLYIPKGTDFGQISLSTDEGKINWKLPCRADSFKISNSYGKIFAENIESSVFPFFTLIRKLQPEKS